MGFDLNDHLTLGWRPLGVSTYVVASSLGEKVTDFREVKEPCWKLLGCSKYVYPVCPAYRQRHKPCWECASTECRNMLNLKWECKDCKVYKLYHTSE